MAKQRSNPFERNCSDCAYAKLDRTMTREEKKMVYRMCKTPGCPSWEKKNKNRRRPSVEHKRSYA